MKIDLQRVTHTHVYEASRIFYRNMSSICIQWYDGVVIYRAERGINF